MAYTPYYTGGWQSDEAGDTPITPAALNNMESGIEAANVEISLTTATWADVYSQLSQMAQNKALPFSASTQVATLITGSVVNQTLKGIVMSNGSGIYDFFCMAGSGSVQACFRISELTSASVTPTIGTVNRYWGGATTADSKAALGIVNDATIDFQVMRPSSASQMLVLAGTVANSTNQYYGHRIGLIISNTGLGIWDFTDERTIWTITA